MKFKSLNNALLINKLNVESYTKKIGAYIEGRLERIRNENIFIGEVRARGLMFGIEYVKDKKDRIPDQELAKKVRRLCYENGLLVEIGGYYNNVVRFLPPLIITEKIAKNALDIFDSVNKIIMDDRFC